MVRDYRKAFKIRLENERNHMARINDHAAWLNGIYMTKALQSTYLMVNGFVPKGVTAMDYPDKPFYEAEEERQKQEEKVKREEQQMQYAMAMMQARVAQFNKNFLRRQQEEAEKRKQGMQKPST